ncbi:LOW QUALITY PROTEIN: hypothetical protein YC2023_010423 [Brassica napus]
MLLGGSTPKKIRNVATKNLKDHPIHKIRNENFERRGVIHSYFFKGEPPDTQPIPKPKQFQGDTSDRRSVLGVYLDNQKAFVYETKFKRRLTHQGVIEAWNFKINFMDQKFMNFTKVSHPVHLRVPDFRRRFKPRKERPEPKSIIGFRRGLSYFQKAQFEENWTRKSEDMIQLLEPAKPVLHLPHLEAYRFNHLQTRHWRPGDQSIHLGSLSSDSEESDNQHLIRRILINTTLPYLEQTDINVQRLFFYQAMDDFRTYKSCKKVSRKLFYP